MASPGPDPLRLPRPGRTLSAQQFPQAITYYGGTPELNGSRFRILNPLTMEGLMDQIKTISNKEQLSDGIMLTFDFLLRKNVDCTKQQYPRKRDYTETWECSECLGPLVILLLGKNSGSLVPHFSKES
ncbi:uncharacterized protein LOC103170102 [Ornithorhynchus anatinus]|uniref:uncharacterized protein LOC103170102 n=1 Tax=Ornithorhynchus anatinus TaxID=9258 RepID=UPI0010A8D57A|nr:uncharacterized protein LOC103170102 [Ornithorhynchus anatinus]